MAHSDFPTVRPASKKELLFERLRKVAHVVYVVGGAIATAAIWSYSHYQALATDQELAAAVSAHNVDAEAHSATLQLLLREQREVKELLKQGRADDIMLGERLVRLLAADREPSHARKAAAATWYAEEYRRLVRRGSTIEDALLEALRTPWRSQ